MGTDAIKVIYNIINNVSSENLKLKASMFIIDKVIQIEDNETIKRIDEIEFALLQRGGRWNIINQSTKYITIRY